MADASSDLIIRASIEALFLAASVAITTKDLDSFRRIVHRLEAIAEDADTPQDLSKMAAKLHDELGADMTDSGLAQMKAAVASLNGASAKLQAAIKIAKQGKDRLAIPALADAAKKALMSFQGLKDAVAALNTDLRGATSAQLGDIPKKLKDVVSDIDALTK